MRLQAGLRSAAAVAIVAASAWIPLLIQASPVDAATHAHVTMGRHSTIIRVDDSQDPDPGADSSATDGSDSPSDSPTDAPTDDPTDAPTDDPTDDPTDLSTSRDSQGSDAGSSSSNSATDGATDGASDGATDAPTDEPTDAASDEPTDSATDEPTDSPNDASSADGQGSNQSSGNPGEPSGADIAANGAAAIADGGIFGGGQGSSTHITLGVVVGARAAGAPVDIDVEGFTPGSTLTLTVRSTPVVIGTAVVPDTGVVSLHGVLPSDLEPGVHQVIVTDEGGTAPGAMVLLNLDDQGMVTAIAPQGDIPSESTNTSLLARALDLGKPLYNSLAHPATVAAAAITGAAVAGVAGSMGGASAAGSGARSGGSARVAGEGGRVEGGHGEGGHGEGGHGGREAQGHGHVFELEGIEVVDLEVEKTGDRSRTWRTPWVHDYQRVLVRIYEATSRYSLILPRTLSDGMWARAMFGSAALLLWVAGITVGLSSLIQTGFSVVPASFAIILAIIVLGVLDAMAGLLAWATISLGALVTGHLTTMDDFLTIVGIGLLAVSLSFFAHHLRPIRRHIHSGLGPVFDRCADYAISPVIVAFTALGLAEGLNGLSGLELVSHEDLLYVELVTGAAVAIRMILEDLALHHYPQRCKAVSFPQHHKPSRPWRVAAIACRTLITFLVFGAFIGYAGFALGAALLLAVPLLMDVFRSRVPRIQGLHQFLPEGIVELTTTAVIGVILASYFFKWGPAAHLLPGLLVLTFVPSALFAILHGISAGGEPRLGKWARRLLGVPVYVFIVGLLSGVIVLVH